MTTEFLRAWLAFVADLNAAEALAFFGSLWLVRDLCLDGSATALAHGLIHDDGSRYGDIERGDLSCHGDTQEVVTGFFHEVVKAGALPTENEDAIG